MCHDLIQDMPSIVFGSICSCCGSDSHHRLREVNQVLRGCGRPHVTTRLLLLLVELERLGVEEEVSGVGASGPSVDIVL